MMKTAVDGTNTPPRGHVGQVATNQQLSLIPNFPAFYTSSFWSLAYCKHTASDQKLEV